MNNFDFAIVGGGIMGAIAACELARDRARVVIIDQSTLPNPRGASIDHSKVFRFAYPDPLYAALAVEALNGWRELEDATGATLLTPADVLMIGRDESSPERETYQSLRSLNLEAELLTNAEVAHRFPQFDSDAFSFAVLDPNGAILHAERAVRAALGLAKHREVSIIEGRRVIGLEQSKDKRIAIVTDLGSEVRCGRALVASGPWTRNLLSFLASKLTTTRQEVVYFEPPVAGNFEPGRFPIFLELESGFYGFPVHHRGWMKIANHHKGEPVNSYEFDDRVGKRFVESCREFFRRFIPGLADAPEREMRVCLYNNTPDDDFVIDWHTELRDVLIATGFSGHGFKFGPVIGKIAADLLRARATSYSVERFALDRFERGDG